MLNDAQLKALGLTRSQLGTRTVVPPPVDDTGEGAARDWVAGIWASVSALSAAPVEELPFHPLDVPAAQAVGMRVERMAAAPHLLKVSLPEGVEFRIIPERGEPGSVSLVDEADPFTVFLDLHSAGATRIVLPGEEGIVAAVRADGSAEVCYVAGSVIEIPPFEALDSPLEQWCEECSDAWLVEEIVDRLRSGHPWDHVAAMGMYARFLDPPDREAVVRAVDALLGGGSDDFWVKLDRVRTWMQGLTPEQLDTVEDLAHAAVDLMGRDLLDLGRADGEQDAESVGGAWARRLLDVCHGRDDLEGVYRILTHVERSARLETGLELVDHAGEELMAALAKYVGASSNDRAEEDQTGVPRALLAAASREGSASAAWRLLSQDERLRRVLLGDPEAWWARPAQAAYDPPM